MENLDKYIRLTRGCTVYKEGEDKPSCLTYQSDKLHVFDWLENVPRPKTRIPEIVEVRFKNNRKDFFRNTQGLPLRRGDIVAVEASPGHDIGVVSLVGDLVYWQLKKLYIPIEAEFKTVYRKARPNDIEKWVNAIKREDEVFRRAKEIIEDMGLKMKLGVVEFQGDGSKAIFYYTADNRVDFRELIKAYASEFKIRVEMRQIGARQESAKIGALGSCGRELCCSTWKNAFVSVTTNAARFQELSLNPSKLAGQCGKLKCCLNYELDAYLEARRNFPDPSIPLQTKEGTAYYQKSDVFKGILWYSFDPENSVNMTPIPVERVEQIIQMNKDGKSPDSLLIDNKDLNDIISSKHNLDLNQDIIANNKMDETFKEKALHNKRKKKKNTGNKQNNYRRKNNNHNNKRGKNKRK